MSAALGLYRLQQVDSQIDQIQARLKAIQQILDNETELRAATEQLAASESSHKDAERALRESEAEVEKQSIKIKQAEASLYGGKVHNPKELQDLQMDVASLKKHLATLEERELEAMLAAETSESNRDKARSDLERVETSLGQQTTELARETESLRRDLDRLHLERQAVAGDIPIDAMAKYDQLRQQRRGLAVATLSDGSCAACGSNLTPSQQQAARSQAGLANCPSCGRILYAD